MFPKRKILFFVPGTVGGAERVTATIANFTPKDVFDVKVVMVGNKERLLAKFIRNVPIVNLYWKSLKDFPTIRLYKFIRQEKPDIVFSSLQVLNVRLPLAAYLAGVKQIVIRNDIGWSSWSKLNQAIAKVTLKFANAIVCQTEDMRDEFRKALPKLKSKIICIPNPLDIDTIKIKTSDCESSPMTQGTINYVYVGRISQEKCIDILLKAFKLVCENNPDARLYIVGDYTFHPDYYKSLQILVHELSLVHKVFFEGFQTNPYKYLKFADCFVLPSMREGNPNVLHEAMHLLVPSVATRSIPIIDKILTPDRGIVVNVNDPTSLSEAMVKALDIHITTPYPYTGGKQDFIDLFNGKSQLL